MSLEAGFILAAGKGTRMGELGRTLPKPLWPVFDLSLLELSIQQLKDLGVKKIYANIHHQAKVLSDYIRTKKLDIEPLHEKELLGSGGAFHNLKKKTGEQAVLALNSDCLYFFNPEVLVQLSQASKSQSNLLLGQKVRREDQYNEWLVQDGWLRGIKGPSLRPFYWTFSGVSLIDLSSLQDVPGKSSFFKTVALPEPGKTRVFESEFQIYDFGTVELYESSVWKTFEDRELMKKLESLGALSLGDLDVKNRSYRSQSESVLNFSSKEVEFAPPGIYLESGGELFRLRDGLVSPFAPRST